MKQGLAACLWLCNSNTAYASSGFSFGLLSKNMLILLGELFTLLHKTKLDAAEIP